MASLNFAQFFSFWIYSVRRAHTDAQDLVTTDILDSAHAQYAEIGGAGLIMLNQLGVALTTFIRYFSYIRISPEHHRLFHHPAHIDRPQRIAVIMDDKTQPRLFEERLVTSSGGADTQMSVPGPYRDEGQDSIPSYNLPALTGVGLALRALLVAEVFVFFCWWVTQIVGESESGVLDSVTLAQSYLFNERMFMLCSVLVAGSLIPSVYAERQREMSTVLAACLTTLTVLAGWFILVWPWMYQSISTSGYLRQEVCSPDSSFCRLTKASAAFAILQGFILLFAALLAVARLRRAAPLDAATSRESGLLIRLSLGVLWVMEALVWVWALATVAATVRNDWVGFFQQWQSVSTSASIAGGPVGNAFTEGYWASFAFLLLVLLVAVGWLISANASTFEWQSRPTRLLTVLVCFFLVTATLPMLIQACRFARDLSMNGDQRAFVAVFILLPLLSVCLLAAVVVRCAEPMYRQLESGKVVDEQSMVASPLPSALSSSEVTMVDVADRDASPVRLDMERAGADPERVGV